ncbi:MAG: hypothetical protein R6U98_07360 [Pirellulaceae bacterium]
MNASQQPGDNDRLSAEQSVEAAGQIEAVTKTGLPLVPGLRALAAEQILSMATILFN